MGNSSQKPQVTRERLKSCSLRVLGYLLAGAALVWAFHGVDFRRLLDHLFEIRWWLVALAVLVDILSYVSRAVRWRFLLKPVAPISVFCSTQAVFAGMLGNQLFPARLGELIRTYIVSRWSGKEFAKIFPSVITERLIDGLWTAFLIAFLAFFLPLPKKVTHAADFLGAGVLVTVALLLAAAHWRKDFQSGAKHQGRWGRVWRFVDRLLAGLRQLGLSRWMLIAIGITLAQLFLQALTFWLIMRAYGIQLSPLIGATVFFIVYVGVVLPTTPGDVGLYQLFCILGLSIFGVDRTVAAGFSIVVFFLRVLPVMLLGLVALKKSGVSLDTIRKDMAGSG